MKNFQWRRALATITILMRASTATELILKYNTYKTELTYSYGTQTVSCNYNVNSQHFKLETEFEMFYTTTARQSRRASNSWLWQRDCNPIKVNADQLDSDNAGVQHGIPNTTCNQKVQKQHQFSR